MSWCCLWFQDLFYSRKNFQRPELQDNVHQNFETEVACLDDMFDSKYSLDLNLVLLNGLIK